MRHRFRRPGTNPNNGKAFEVFSVQPMVDANGADVASYLPVKDAKLRADELGARQAELDARWEAHKATLVASNPAMTPAELDFHKSIFNAKPDTASACHSGPCAFDAIRI
jgi:hypothetical protein